MGTAAVQGRIWGARASDWANVNEPAWATVFETALDRAGVGAGTRHLDIGCGAGGAMTIAAGRGAIVAGRDASASLVAIARTRLPAAAIEIGDMEELPFADDSFTAVTAINSLQFSGDPVAALREARRVLARGGRLAGLVWGPRDACELIAGTASKVFALVPADPNAKPPVAFAQPGVIEAMMEAAGLAVVDGGEFDHALVFADASAATRAVLAASARAVDHAGEAAVIETIRATLPSFTRADGSVVWRNRFRWVRASKA